MQNLHDVRNNVDTIALHYINQRLKKNFTNRSDRNVRKLTENLRYVGINIGLQTYISITPSIRPPCSKKSHGNVQIGIKRRKASVVDERHASMRVREIGFEPGKKRERGVRGAGRIPFCLTAFATGVGQQCTCFSGFARSRRFL